VRANGVAALRVGLHSACISSRVMLTARSGYPSLAAGLFRLGAPLLNATEVPSFGTRSGHLRVRSMWDFHSTPG
jgi:hypothetical protein